MWVLTWTGSVYPGPEVAPEEAAMGLLGLGASRGCRGSFSGSPWPFHLPNKKLASKCGLHVFV